MTAHGHQPAEGHRGFPGDRHGRGRPHRAGRLHVAARGHPGRPGRGRAQAAPPGHRADQGRARPDQGRHQLEDGGGARLHLRGPSHDPRGPLPSLRARKDHPRREGPLGVGAVPDQRPLRAGLRGHQRRILPAAEVRHLRRPGQDLPEPGGAPGEEGDDRRPEGPRRPRAPALRGGHEPQRGERPGRGPGHGRARPPTRPSWPGR